MAKLNPGSIHVRLPLQDLADLREIAGQQRPPVEAAELLRRAAVAIIDCWNEHRAVPAEMVIRGRGTLADFSPSRGELMLNDPPAAIPPMGYNLGRLPGDPPPEDPPAAPAKKKTPPPAAGPAGAGAALPRSKPPAAGAAPASA